MLLVLPVVVPLPQANGQIIDWSAQGDGTSYDDPGNWFGFDVPDSPPESARFDSGTFPNNVTFASGSSTTVNDLLVYELTIFETAPTAVTNATYDIGNQLLVDGGVFVVEDSVSGLDVDVTVTNQVDIINGGALVLNGGTFNANGSLVLSATGALAIEGGVLSANAGLDNSAGGTLDFLDGALLVFGGPFIPNSGAPLSVYEVDGPSAVEFPHLIMGSESSADLPFDMYVGNMNQGQLTIDSGATFDVGNDGVIGRLNNSFGIVTVDGIGTSWTNSGDLYVGHDGDGALNISGGGIVSNDVTYIGYAPGSTGSVTVGGGGSRLNSTAVYVGGDTVGSGGNGILTLGGGTVQLNPATGMTVWQTGQVLGHGTIAGKLINSGRVAPGPGPATLFIDGDFTQTKDGVLEIEIGGLAPGTQHDQLIVTGNANIGGRLEVPLIDVGGGVFNPDINDQVVILTAASINGSFDSLFSPNLASVNPNLAMEVVSGLDDMRIRFVEPDTSNSFSGTSEVSNWASSANWVTEVVPGSTDIVDVTNLAGLPQVLEVVFNPGIPGSGNAFVHQANISGAGQPLTVSVKTGSKFSSTIGMTVGDLGIVDLDGGEVVSSTVDVQTGGTITGNGTVVGNLIVGDGGPGPATISPGHSVGQIDVEGNFEQQSGSHLVIEIEGVNQGEFDAIDVSGQATLDGAVEIVLDDIANAPVGSVINFITADGITGTFDRMITTGVDDYFLAPIYSGGNVVAAAASSSAASTGAPVVAGAMVFEEGDMDPSVPGLGEEDAIAFALGLTDPATYTATFGIDPIESGNIDDDSDFDFDDIQPFVALLNSSLVAGMTMERMMDIIQAVQVVPEPNSVVLLFLGICGWGPTLRKGRST